MTEQEFMKRSFRHSQPYDIINKRTGKRIECLITAVDFDNGTLRMSPIEFDKVNYEYNDVWVSYEYCFPPVNKLKAIPCEK